MLCIMPITLPSFAKINWSLSVLGRRDDGYHELCTIFQTVSLYDTLTFEASDRLELECDLPDIPTDESNLIIKAAKGLGEMCGRELTGKISLNKRIPSPGGLGSGSSNAAIAIIGLCELNKIELPKESEIASLAESLGADVPYFFYGGTALGTGRGDKIYPLPSEIEAPEMMIVTPAINISTGDIFSSLNADSLTSETAESIISVCREEALNFVRAGAVLKNDLEPIVFSSYPEVKRVKQALIDLGAVSAAMSGSGASVFAIFDKKETRQAAEKALDLESTWRKFAVSAISRSQYREALGLN